MAILKVAHLGPPVLRQIAQSPAAETLLVVSRVDSARADSLRLALEKQQAETQRKTGKNQYSSRQHSIL